MTRLQQTLESKVASRRWLARKPIAEELRIVEEVAERATTIRNRRARRRFSRGG